MRHRYLLTTHSHFDTIETLYGTGELAAAVRFASGPWAELVVYPTDITTTQQHALSQKICPAGSPATCINLIGAGDVHPLGGPSKFRFVNDEIAAFILISFTASSRGDAQARLTENRVDSYTNLVSHPGTFFAEIAGLNSDQVFERLEPLVNHASVSQVHVGITSGKLTLPDLSVRD
jgi:hypothetical protein